MIPRLVIAGTASGVGKTTISIGLMAALTEKGFDVQPFKVGPDYIDPGFHNLVTGNTAYNLDSYFLNQKRIKETLAHGAKNSDISIIEGVMGLFDGKRGKDNTGSTAQVAKILQTPVILVIDAKKMAQSAAAMAYGYQNFDQQLDVKGVIFNNIASKGHYQMIKERIKGQLDLKVLGYLPNDKELKLPERYLGLVPTSESDDLKRFITKLKSLIKNYIDLEKVVELAKEASELKVNEQTIFNLKKEFDLKLGLAYDKAFNFYYQANLDILEELGAELKYFSPLNDKKLPEVDGLYLGGGFPESYLAELETNKSMQDDIYQQVKSGLAIYAECGGLAYLAEEIIDFTGKSFSMLGLIPARVEMTDKLQAMGYVKAKARHDNLLLKAGEEVKGHEFHYSKLILSDKKNNYSYQLSGGKEESVRKEGVVANNLLASYVHLNFASKIDLARRFLQHCSKD